MSLAIFFQTEQARHQNQWNIKEKAAAACQRCLII